MPQVLQRFTLLSWDLNFVSLFVCLQMLPQGCMPVLTCSLRQVLLRALSLSHFPWSGHNRTLSSQVCEYIVLMITLRLLYWQGTSPVCDDSV